MCVHALLAHHDLLPGPVLARLCFHASNPCTRHACKIRDLIFLSRKGITSGAEAATNTQTLPTCHATQCLIHMHIYVQTQIQTQTHTLYDHQVIARAIMRLLRGSVAGAPRTSSTV